MMTLLIHQICFRLFFMICLLIGAACGSSPSSDFPDEEKANEEFDESVDEAPLEQPAPIISSPDPVDSNEEGSDIGSVDEPQFDPTPEPVEASEPKPESAPMAEPADQEPILAEKLIGTPFEGLTIGDTIPVWKFVCDEFFTAEIAEFPIPIYAAFFTASEEEMIQDGIDIANKAMGETVFELTDTWDDNLRMIYKIDEFKNNSIAAGIALSIYYTYNNKNFAETVVWDFMIRLADEGVNPWVVAHELGHAMGMGHYLIDYQNDIASALEENSLMQGFSSGSNSTLTDYNFMMQEQKNILENHFGESHSYNCSDEEKDLIQEYYE